MDWNAEQQAILREDRNLLVAAGAGTGKTATLVEHLIQSLLRSDEQRLSLAEVLVVTFTEAAAAEMRDRIRRRLYTALQRGGASVSVLQHELLLLETASISTLHSFCLGLLREYGPRLGLDPQFRVVEPAQARLVQEEVTTEVIAEVLEEEEQADGVRDLLWRFCRADEDQLIELLLRIYRLAQTHVHPEGWLRTQEERWRADAVSGIHGPVEKALCQWRREWIETFWRYASVDPKAREILAVLEAEEKAEQGRAGSPDAGLAWVRLMKDLKDLDRQWREGRRGITKFPYDRFFAEVQECTTFFEDVELATAIERLRLPMQTLLVLVRRFTQAYHQRKQEEGWLEFHDLEQHTLDLLLGTDRRTLTPEAKEIGGRFRRIYVDEYQDINPAQDAILRALAQAGAFRYLVGDAKQSIYGFRLTDPRIFQEYRRRWGKEEIEGAAVRYLSTNYRSHPKILQFVNSLFRELLRPELVDMAMEPGERLQPGLSHFPSGGEPPSAKSSPAVVEWLLLRRSDDHGDSASEEEVDAWAEMDGLEREIHEIASWIRRLHETGTLVRDPKDGRRRPVRWEDICILLRSPATVLEAMVKGLAQHGIPVAASGFSLYDSPEIADLLAVLALLDNPLQDVAALTVLRGPFVGLSPDTLARIRFYQPKGKIWESVLAALRTSASDPSLPQETESSSSESESSRSALGPNPSPEISPETSLPELPAEAVDRLRRFLDHYRRWRGLARQIPLTHLLELILDDTGYEDWLRSRPGAEEALDRLRQLLQEARSFDSHGGGSLRRFLQYIEARRQDPALQSAEPIVADHAVRIMSIHQSKGLEFPVVILAGLGRQFNRSDERAPILLDPDFGLAPRWYDPDQAVSQHTLLSWTAAKTIRRKQLSEEARLLYVAMTRARDFLLLCGTLPTRKRKTRSRNPSPSFWPVLPVTFLHSTSPLSWLLPFLESQLQEFGPLEELPDGTYETPLCRVRLCSGPTSAPPPAPSSDSAPSEATQDSPSATWLQEQLTILSSPYAYHPATRQIAKVSVTELARQGIEEDPDSVSWWEWVTPSKGRETKENPTGPADAVTRGLATHRLLQWIDFSKDADPLEIQIERLVQSGRFTPEEIAAIDLQEVQAFLESEIVEQLRSPGVRIERELAFTCRISPVELQRLGLPVEEGLESEEYLVIQGAVDLVGFSQEGLYVVDYKTDRIPWNRIEAEHLAAYRHQIQLYGLALTKIYRQPLRQAWLYFLAHRKAVSVPCEGPQSF